VTVLRDDRASLALQALAEVTDPSSVGELIEVTEPEPGVRDLVFACRLPGYIAWRWTVTTAQVGDAAPTVLEVELLPGEGALVAPPWVPWAERLAEYRRTHPDEAEDAAGDLEDDEDEDDDEDDDEDLDEVDPDALELDGVEFEDDAAEDRDDDADEPQDEDDDEDQRAPADASGAWGEDASASAEPATPLGDDAGARAGH
jgi:hypothetical protein